MRPPFCVIGDCAPVREFRRKDQRHLVAGGSYFCAGVLERGEVWTAGSTDHHNKWSLCVYSPFKGWIRFMICEDDARIIEGLICRLREQRCGEVEVADNIVRRLRGGIER